MSDEPPVDELWNDLAAASGRMPCPYCGERIWDAVPGVDAYACTGCSYVIHGYEAAAWRTSLKNPPTRGDAHGPPGHDPDAGEPPAM